MELAPLLDRDYAAGRSAAGDARMLAVLHAPQPSNHESLSLSQLRLGLRELPRDNAAAVQDGGSSEYSVTAAYFSGRFHSRHQRIVPIDHDADDIT